MSTLKKNRGLQYPLEAEFVFNFDDTMLDVNGVSKDFGAADLAARSFAVIALPPNAVVIGGELVTETAFDTAGFDMTVGDSTVANRYLASTDVKAAARVALVPTGYVSDGGDIVISVATDDVCTAGKASLRVQYVIRGRTNEVQAS